MKRNMMITALLTPLLLAGAAYAQHDHSGHEGHKHQAVKKEAPAKAGKAAAAAKKAEAAYRKVTRAEIGKSAVCPVTGEKVKVDKDTISMSYKDRVYYFCCPGCDGSFAAEPEKYAVKEKAVKKKYVCPMGCAESDKPGRCPKCGMDLVEKKKEQPAAKKYSCPMGCVQSEKPGRCPKCGMDMKEKK
ncbi:MAG: copper/silver-translocating P-type ATPase [Elusimicrobia bacterium]|nr:MAG: copper/silver-translocating P-type ATPase [Elusimicrobiota bacterium]KAF0156866.1 MAG: copper/silver-translocating P-type ATPase [Elusimicrobiota bacterium]